MGASAHGWVLSLMSAVCVASGGESDAYTPATRGFVLGFGSFLRVFSVSEARAVIWGRKRFSNRCLCIVICALSCGGIAESGIRAEGHGSIVPRYYIACCADRHQACSFVPGTSGLNEIVKGSRVKLLDLEGAVKFGG